MYTKYSLSHQKRIAELARWFYVEERQRKEEKKTFQNGEFSFYRTLYILKFIFFQTFLIDKRKEKIIQLL